MSLTLPNMSMEITAKLVLSKYVGRLNTLVNFRPAQPSRTGQFSTGVNTHPPKLKFECLHHWQTYDQERNLDYRFDHVCIGSHLSGHGNRVKTCSIKELVMSKESKGNAAAPGLARAPITSGGQ